MKLVKITKYGQVVTTSQAIADLVGVRHKQVFESVSKLLCSARFSGENFTFFAAEDEPFYEITKDGATLLLATAIPVRAVPEMELLINRFNYISDLLAKRDKLDNELSKLLS